MRKTHDREPRVSAAASPEPGPSEQTSWIPVSDWSRAALDPARWSRRARQERYWRTIEILIRQRAFH